MKSPPFGALAHLKLPVIHSQVGASVLSRTLARLRDAGHIDSSIAEDVIVGLDSPDDAAVVRSPGPGWVSIRTVDFFRDFVGDPFVFGRISANHALGDCYAMAAYPKTALAIAIVPFGLPAKVEETLFQMMAGKSRPP
jgi:selenide,water dikinase